MKFLILLLVGLITGFYIRMETTDLGKNMYIEGCTDAAIKMGKVGKYEESKLLTKFCNARKDILNKYFDVL